MKVLHLIGGGDIGGAKSHVLSLVHELGKHIEVRIVSFRHGQFADEGRAMGIKIDVVRTGNIFKDIKQVLHIIRSGDYDIIHSHGAKANLIASAVKRITHLPAVTTVHSDYRLDYLQSIRKRLSFGIINTIALRLIDYYIGVSKNFKDMLVQRNFEPENIFTVYNGIDYDKEIHGYSREEFTKKYGIPLEGDGVVVGIFARLHPVKGISTFIKAAAEVLKKAPDTKFLIFGGDEGAQKSLEAKAVSLGIRSHVYFLGHVNDSDACMNILDINVLTSLSESFPYVILEGARLKKATVSSNVGGLSDLISSGETGYLFTPGNHRELAEYLLKLVMSPELRKELGEKIYIKASTYFSLFNMCNTQLSIYEKILSRATTETEPDTIRSKHRKYKYDVIISGYYGFENSGDDAILAAVINNLRMYKEGIRIIVLSKKPAETRKIYEVNSINRFNPISMIQVMRKSRLFINGGGTLITDITSSRSLLYYLGTIWLAKRLGLMVMIYANGIGPINMGYNKKITQRIVGQVDVITLREELSMLELNNLDIDKKKVIVTADPALTIDPATESKILEIFTAESIPSDGPFVGFSVREWKGFEKQYIETIARLADYMAEKYNIKPVFVPMHYPDDVTISEIIASKMKNPGYLIRNKYGVPEMFGIIKQMEMLVGMRLHSLIYAASLGIPVVGLSYDPKVEGFLKYFNQALGGNVEYLDYETLRSVVEEVWSHKSSIKEQLKDVTISLKEKALENARIAVDLLKK